MSDDGEIELGLDVTDDGAGASIDDLVARVLGAVEGVKRLRTEFLAVASATREARTAAQGLAGDVQKAIDSSPAATLREMIQQSRTQQAAGAYAQSRISATQVRDGRTIGEARITDQTVRGLITGIETETEQLSARLREAAGRAAKRMITATERAIAAELNQTSVAMGLRQARYGTAEAANLRMRAGVIADGRLQSRIGDAQSYDDIVRREAAISLDRQRMQAQSRQVAEQATATQALERQRMAALGKQAEYEASAAAELDRQRQAALARQTIPRLRIRDETGAARDAAIGDKSLSEVQAMDAAQRSAQRARAMQERQMMSAGSGLQGSLMGVLGAGLAIGGIEQTVHGVVELDDAMTKFQAITHTADSELGPFKDKLLDLANGSRFATKDLVETATQLGQTGMSVHEVADALPAAINLATSSGSSLHQAVEVLTSVLGAYNLQASQTASISNIMSGALTKTRLTMSQLSIGLQYSADIASQTGVSISELTAIFGGLAQAGARSGSVMGTQVRQLIREFESPTAKLQKEMSSLGITMQDVDVRANGILGVMDNLKSKGFGTAEALRSLKARTITTFTALQIQGENIKRLHQELLLYSGAADGAALANSSLTARVTQLGNTLLAVADKSLAPAVEGLKGITSGIQSVLEVGLKLGPVLPILGTGVAGLVTGFATFKGLQLAEMLFGATRAMMAFGAATEVTEAAAVGLSAAFGPIGVAIGVITIAAAGIGYLVNEAERAADRIDHLKGSIRDLDSRSQQLTIAGQTLDKTIGNVLAQKEKLNSDPLQLRNTIIEAQKQFQDLGLSIKANTNNVDDLVGSLQRLRAEVSEKLPGISAQRLTQGAQLLDELRKGIPGQQQQRTDDLARAFIPGADTPAMDDGVDAFASGQGMAISARDVTAAVTAQLGPQFGKIAALAQNYKALPEDDARSGASAGFNAIWEKENALRNERVTATADQSDVIGHQLALLTSLESALKKAQDYVSNIQSAKAGQARIANQHQVEVIQATPAYLSLINSRDNLQQSFGSTINKIASEKGITPEARIAEIEAAKKETLAKASILAAQGKTAIDGLLAAGKDRSAITEAYQAVLDSVKNLTTLSMSAEQNAQKLLQKLRVPTLEQDKRTATSQLSALMSQSHQVNDPAQLDVLQAHINGLVDKQKQLQAQIFKARSDNPDDPAAQEEVKKKIAASDEELESQRSKYANELVRERTRIATRIFEQQNKAFAEQQKVLNVQIAGLGEEMRSPNTTLARVRELRAAIDGLISQATQLVKERSNVQYARDLPLLPKGYVPTRSAPEGSVPRGIMDAATTAGRGDLVPFLLQLGQKESSFNPASKIGSAGPQGLFQISPDTAKGLGGGNLADIKTQVRLAIKKLSNDSQSFAKNFGRAPSEQELYLLWQQGSAGGTALMKNPNQLALDSLTAAYGGDRAKATQAITQNYPGADVSTLTSQQFQQHIQSYFGSTADTRKFAQPIADARLTQRNNEQMAADAKAANDRAKLDQVVATRAYKDDEASDSVDKLKSSQKIQALQAVASGKYDSIPQVLAALTDATNIQVGRITKTLTLYDKDPSNGKDKTPAQKDADRQATSAGATDKVVKMVIQAADTIASKGTATDKANLARLTQLQKAQEKHPERFSPAEVAATQQQVAGLHKKVGAEDPLAAAEAALKYMQDFATKLAAMGDADQGEVALLTKEIEIRKSRVDTLKTQQATQKTIEGTGNKGTYGNAISNSTQDFFEKQGLISKPTAGAPAQWTTMVQQMPALWGNAMSAMQSSTAGFFDDWATHSESAGVAFKKFGQSILSSMAQIVSNYLSNQVLKLIFGAALGGVGGSPGILGSLGSFFNFKATGGEVLGHAVRYAATGTYNANRDSVPTMLTPGEFVMRKSAVDMIGRSSLDALNDAGNSRITRSAPTAMAPTNTKQAPPVNVWVVSKDAVPPPGPNDFVHAVADNMSKGGQLKTLVKSISTGKM